MSYSFYIHSDSGESCFLARRLEREGHRVKLFVDSPRAKQVGVGWVNRVNMFAPAKNDIVIFDMVGKGPLAEKLIKSGFKVIGGSQFADAHEIDRAQGHALMQLIGVSIPVTKTFINVKEAKKFLNDQEGDQGWFFKPAGDQDAALTYGARDREDAIRWLDYVKEGHFELQQKAEGAEISIEGWFDGDRWVWPFNSTVEDKKFMAGNVGPNTGCAANVVWAYKETRPILALKTIARLDSVLAETHYCGPVDLNVIIDKKGVPQGLEWTMRFGYDALAALSMLNRGDLGEQLGNFAHGKLDEFEVATDEVALTMRVSTPPYPSYEHAIDKRGLPIDPDIMSDIGSIFPQDILVDRRKGPCITGSDASVAVFGGRGRGGVISLREKLLKKIGRFRIPDAQYRVDGCERYYKVDSALRKFGYDTAMEPGFSRRDLGEDDER